MADDLAYWYGELAILRADIAKAQKEQESTSDGASQFHLVRPRITALYDREKWILERIRELEAQPSSGANFINKVVLGRPV